MTTDPVGMYTNSITHTAIEDPKVIYVHTAHLDNTVFGTEPFTSIKISATIGHQGIGSFYTKVDTRI